MSSAAASRRCQNAASGGGICGSDMSDMCNCKPPNGGDLCYSGGVEGHKGRFSLCFNHACASTRATAAIQKQTYQGLLAAAVLYTTLHTAGLSRHFNTQHHSHAQTQWRVANLAGMITMTTRVDEWTSVAAWQKHCLVHHASPLQKLLNLLPRLRLVCGVSPCLLSCPVFHLLPPLCLICCYAVHYSHLCFVLRSNSNGTANTASGPVPH